jgi:hypothetical protein
MSVHFFHGDKGGVGKSFVAASFVDWLIARRGLLPLVVDCDMRNPDLARMFSGATTTQNESAHGEVVISLPAGVGAEVADELPAFIAGAAELRREVTLLWVLSRTPDSINLLRPAMAAFAGQARAMVVLKNLFFGDASRFGRWNESKTRTAFEDANGIVVEFPDLLDRLVDQTAMAHPPVPFSTKLEGLRFGDRSELSRWLAKVDALWTSLSSPLGVS